MEWFMYRLAVISPDMVAERHYFLEWFNTPAGLWTIRGIFVVAGIVALVLYKKMKKDGE